MGGDRRCVMKPQAARYAHHPPRIGTERRVPVLRVVGVRPEVSPVPLPILVAAGWTVVVLMQRLLKV